MNEPTSILALPSVRQLTAHFENCTYRALAESIHVTKSYDQSTRCATATSGAPLQLGFLCVELGQSDRTIRFRLCAHRMGPFTAVTASNPLWHVPAGLGKLSP
jgi:hypothetical protein